MSLCASLRDAQDGKRDGIGVKRYVDGSTFDGFWKDGKKHGIGVFRPPQVRAQHTHTQHLLCTHRGAATDGRVRGSACRRRI